MAKRLFQRRNRSSLQDDHADRDGLLLSVSDDTKLKDGDDNRTTPVESVADDDEQRRWRHRLPKQTKAAVAIRDRPKPRDGTKLFYVNVTILDASDAVYRKVYSTLHEKLSRTKFIPGPVVKTKLANAIAGGAASTVSPNLIAKKMSIKIPKVLMYQLGRKGLKLHAETVFLELNYFVIQLQIQHADPLVLAQSLADDQQKEKEQMNQKATQRAQSENDTDVTDDVGDDDSVASAVIDAWLEEQDKLDTEEATSPFVVTSRLDAKVDAVNNTLLSRSTALVRCLKWLKSFISERYRVYLESNYLPNLMQAKISAKVDENLSKKLKDKCIVAETEVLLEDRQARYFYNQLYHIRRMDKETKGGQGLAKVVGKATGTGSSR
jgi:hypothetical protein